MGQQSEDQQQVPPGAHVSVLLDEVVEWLVGAADAHRYGGPPLFVDCTLGGGGHAEALLDASEPGGKLLGLDADLEAIERAGRTLSRFGDRATLVHANFEQLGAVAERHGFLEVQGIVMDLGLSSPQLDVSGRGFSFRHDEPLDMRFDTTRGETAADVLNRMEERDLADLIYRYGEERGSRRVARQVIWRRAKRPFERTGDLVAAVEAALGPRRGRIHPATRTFQALRIAVNGELQALENTLPQAASLLRPGGRMAVISFHSLEDRLVKWFFRNGGTETAPLRPLTNRPITPGAAEGEANPRARSA